MESPKLRNVRNLIRFQQNIGKIIDTEKGIRIFLDPNDDSSILIPSIDVFFAPIDVQPTEQDISELHQYMRTNISPKPLPKLSKLLDKPIVERRLTVTTGSDYMYAGLNNKVNPYVEQNFKWLEKIRNYCRRSC